MKLESEKSLQHFRSFIIKFDNLKKISGPTSESPKLVPTEEDINGVVGDDLLHGH